jgi:hypothetical protein
MIKKVITIIRVAQRTIWPQIEPPVRVLSA